jgi:hypothetical protein
MRKPQGRVKVGEKGGSAVPRTRDTESLWLSGHARPSSFLHSAGRRSLPAEWVRLVGTQASWKGEAFPHPACAGRQSRFAILPFGDFDATLGKAGFCYLPERRLC